MATFDLGTNISMVLVALIACWAIVRITEAKYYNKDDDDAKPE